MVDIKFCCLCQLVLQPDLLLPDYPLPPPPPPLSVPLLSFFLRQYLFEGGGLRNLGSWLSDNEARQKQAWLEGFMDKYVVPSSASLELVAINFPLLHCTHAVHTYPLRVYITILSKIG